MPLDSRKLGLRNYRAPDAFGKWLGYDVAKVDRKRFAGELRLKVRKSHLSPANRLHGGVISACFDSALALAVFADMGPHDLCSTVELKVNYFRPVELGDELVFRSQAVYRGRRLCSAQGYLYVNGAKEPAAMASGTWNIVRGSGVLLKTAPAARRVPRARGRKS